jgi:hypothetical protein
LKEFKYKKEVLERKKELWLQNQETKRNIIDKMSINILQMKSMIARNEFLQHKAKKGGGKGSFKGVNTTKRDLKNQEKVGLLTRKVQGFVPCVCQQQIGGV